MDYQAEIRSAGSDPGRLEDLYRQSEKSGAAAVFYQGLLAARAEAPENLLYAAWFYRLQDVAEKEKLPARGANWKLAVPLGVLAGAILWGISDPKLLLPGNAPYFALFWSPVAAGLILIYLHGTARKDWLRALLAWVGLAAVTAYIFFVGKNANYINIALIHLPLLAWITAGISVLGLWSAYRERFAFISKSLEVFITGGLFVIAGGAFFGITSGLFDALNVHLSDPIIRLILLGGGGLIAVLSVATIYDPLLAPSAQSERRGLSRVIATLMYVLLPLSLLVLLIYTVVVAFNFMQPFYQRDVLIIYNVMLFAIMILLLAATPQVAGELSPRNQSLLRYGIVALAVMAGWVSLYALAAIIYRTVLGDFTINRVTVIGWNLINLGLLAVLVYRQVRWGKERWLEGLQRTFSDGTNAYLVWSILLVLITPWIFQ